MIEYDAEKDVYIVRYYDETDVKGWIRELNGLIFIGINQKSAAEKEAALVEQLMKCVNVMLRKEMPVGVIEGHFPGRGRVN